MIGVLDNRNKKFKHGFCDCCGNFSVCVLTHLCPSIVLGQTAAKSGCGNCCCVACCNFHLCPWSFLTLPFTTCLVRGQIRGQERIEGNACEDCLASFCCTCCAIIQSAREINALGDARQTTMWKL